MFAHVGVDRREVRLPVGVEHLDEVSADAGALRLASGCVYSRVWVSHDEVDERGDLLGRATLVCTDWSLMSPMCPLAWDYSLNPFEKKFITTVLTAVKKNKQPAHTPGGRAG
jgi:hypothetical protein